jgi:EAL domain-containing protein (putative c-di-GMP-specific phosphodiesterase class I)
MELGFTIRTGERRGNVAGGRDYQLEAMIGANALEVLFQPWIELGSGRVVAAEALTRSKLEPNAALLFDRAARAGLDGQLSRLAQRKALGQATRWFGPLQRLGLSLNLRPQEVATGDHDRWLLTEMDRVGFDPRRLTVEITEDALIVGEPTVIERLERLRSAGVTIALDDFGTGYASLDYLNQLPIDLIKIDRALVAGLVSGQRDRIVMEAMLRLAQQLHIRTLVEGVEDAAQLTLLGDWDCDLFQGFLGARPLSESALHRFAAAANGSAT